ncbi:hypothetical protein ACTRW9_10615 [Nitrospina sp. 32_T5]|uniref:hypothetical protein n=1 Tax=unclassified Nitrospina TaxID=2638683 RepID=UPI003F9B466F
MDQKTKTWEGEEIPYSPILIKKNGKFYFLLRELSLISSGDSVESAYQNLLKDQEVKLKTFREIDGMDHLPTPLNYKQNEMNKPLMDNYKIRVITDLIKFSVVALLFAFVLQFGMKGVILDVNKIMNSEIGAAKKKLKAHILDPVKVDRNNETLINGIKNYKPAIQEFLSLLPIQQLESQKKLTDDKRP